jgi:hypothetical protein
MPGRRQAINAIRRIGDLDLAECNVELYLAATTADEPTPDYQYVQITADVANEFREVFRNVREHLESEIVLRAYDAGSKPDSHEVEYFVLEDFEVVNAQILPLVSIARPQVFSADEEFVGRLRFYVMVMRFSDGGGPVYAFRTYSKHKELQQSHMFGFVFARGQFNRVAEPVFLFDSLCDCIATDGVMLVLKQDSFQKVFRYFEMVRRAADATLARIRERIPISNFRAFEDSCRTHIQKLAKLKNIAQKPYLDRITMRDIKKAIRRYQLPVQVTRQDGTEMLVYNENDRWAILRLLDDDYLESIMTDEAYEVTGKRRHERAAE